MDEYNWIPISERIPEERGYYLVTIDLTFSRGNRYVEVCHSDSWENLKKCGHEVLAWMPLLKPYSGE